MPNTLLENPNLQTIAWRDLLKLTPAQKLCELTLPVPWLIASLFFYHRGNWIPGAFCSFYFFLTGLRQSHGAQHYTLGLGKRWEDLVLFVLSLVMLGSMHAVQVSHLHHHRHCLEEDDAEGSTARLSWWRALLAGPIFPLRLHTNAWRIGSRVKRSWITAEIAGIFFVILAAISFPSLALRAHILVMLAGESMTGFFAVWTVHHDCDAHGLHSRTQRGRWINRLCYNMFFHAEHHLFPLVPTCHLAQLADRLDAAAPELAWKQVLGPTRKGQRFYGRITMNTIHPRMRSLAKTADSISPKNIGSRGEISIRKSVPSASPVGW